MKRIITALISLAFAIQLVGPASFASQLNPYEKRQDAPLEGQFAASVSVEGHGPSDGDFSAWTKVLGNGRQLKFYAKYLKPGAKVQFMVQGGSGEYEQVAWKRISDGDLNDDGSYSNLQNHVYFIRTIDLSPGKNRVRILVDGEVVWGTKTYSFDPDKVPTLDEAPDQEPATLLITSDSGPKSGRAEFLLTSSGLADYQSIGSLCFVLDGSAATSTLIPKILIDSTTYFLDSQGCLSSTTGIVESSQITVPLETGSLEDKIHKLEVTGVIKTLTETITEIEASANFVTDNHSLQATAPQPTLYGSYMAGTFVTVNAGYWGQGVTLSYKWYLNGLLVRGANSDKYLLTQADVGKTLRAEITGKKSEADVGERSIETPGPITPQAATSASQGSVFEGSAAFNIVETDSVYNSTTRQYEEKEVNNYNVTISYPSVVVCEPTSSYSYSSCTFEANVGWAGTFDSYESFVETAKLVRVNDGAQVASASIYLSKLLGSETNKLTFRIPFSSLRSNNSLNSFTIQISDAGYDQTLTSLGSTQVQLITGPNNSSGAMNYQVTDQAITQSQAGYVYKGGTASNPQWTLWQYATPSSVKVMQECAVLPIYLAPQSLEDGSLKDPRTQRAADATISIYGQNGALRERVSVIGSRGDWTTLFVGNRLDIKACDLKIKKGEKETLRIQLDLRYDALNFEATHSTSLNISMIGNMTFTTINCYKGAEGLIITAYKPACPSGWTKTSAEVEDGKVVMTTINCLKGTDVEVVTAPEPSCPAGYEVTQRKVRDGKLVPWTITCTKGLSVRKIIGVFPKCPAGYK